MSEITEDVVRQIHGTFDSMLTFNDQDTNIASPSSAISQQLEQVACADIVGERMADYLRLKGYSSMIARTAYLFLAMNFLVGGRENWKPSITWLIGAGPWLEIPLDDDQRKFIHIAALRGNTWLVEKLCDAGVEVDSICNGFSALHMAITKGHVLVVKELIKARADVNLMCNGMTPLTLTVSWFIPDMVRIDIVQALLWAGADERLVGEFDDRPLIQLVESKIRNGNVSQGVLEKLLFCPIWRKHKLLFLIRSKRSIKWPALEDMRRTRSARKNEVFSWFLAKYGGAPEDIFRRIMTFVLD